MPVNFKRWFWRCKQAAKKHLLSHRCPPLWTSSCLPAICGFVRYSHMCLLVSVPCGQNVAVVSLPCWENIRWINNSPEAEQKIRKSSWQQGKHGPTENPASAVLTRMHTVFTAPWMLDYYIKVFSFMFMCLHFIAHSTCPVVFHALFLKTNLRLTSVIGFIAIDCCVPACGIILSNLRH